MISVDKKLRVTDDEDTAVQLQTASDSYLLSKTMKTPNVPEIYCWKAQDIPEPDPEGAPIDTGVPLDGRAIVQEAIDRLLDNLDAEFFIAPHDGSSEYNVTSEIGKIDRKVGRIRSIMLAVKHELGRRVSLLSKHRNAIVPFGKLPVELVGSMLACATSVSPDPLSPSSTDYDYTPISRLKELATVSVGWWNAIRSSPALWTVIGPEPDSRAVALKIRKSGTLPLHIVTWPNHTHPANFADALATHLSRWKSVHLDLGLIAGAEAIRQHLGAPLPRLEALKLVWVHSYSRIRPIQLGEGGMLRHLDLEGIIPHHEAPVLRNITHLTLTEITYIHTADMLSVLACTTNLESLTIRNLGDPGEGPFDTAGLSLPIQLPTLKRLILEWSTQVLCRGLLEGVHADNLSYLVVKRSPSKIEEGTTILLQLIRPNGQIHGSILSTIIANSSTVTFKMEIQNNSYLTLTGHRSGKEVSFSVNVRDSQWHHPDNSEQLSAFALSLPPVRLFLSEKNTHWDDKIQSPSSLFFIRSIPSIIRICIFHRRDLAELLFRDFLADEYGVERERRWICPKLTEVWIGREAHDQDCESTIREALRRRSEAVRDEPLPKISVFYEGEDGYWTEKLFDSPLDD